MAKIIDLTGQKFGRLTAIRRIGRTKSYKSIWLCQCDCGKETEALYDNLCGGNTKSCGCYNNEILKTKSLIHGHKTSKKTSSEYISWRGMKDRCLKQNHEHYAEYGGRGITICDRWVNSFKNFLEDMGLKPTEKHTIERIDNNGNYDPLNCKWATIAEQSINKRINKRNKSGISGVSWDNTNSKWVARIGAKSKRIHLGYFDSIEKAALARARAEIKFWGNLQ